LGLQLDLLKSILAPVLVVLAIFASSLLRARSFSRDFRGFLCFIGLAALVTAPFIQPFLVGRIGPFRVVSENRTLFHMLTTRKRHWLIKYHPEQVWCCFCLSLFLVALNLAISLFLAGRLCNFSNLNFADSCEGEVRYYPLLFALLFPLFFMRLMSVGASIDEAAYLSVGRRYFSGLLALDYSSFLFSGWGGIEHPPFAKLLAGAVSAIMLSLGLPSGYPVPCRVTSALMFVLTALAVFKLTSGFAGERGGILASILYSLEVLLFRDPIGLLDNTCSFFIALCILLLLKSESAGSSLPWVVGAGLAWGFSFGSKFAPSALLVPFLFVLSRKIDRKDLAAFLLVGLTCSLILYPAFYTPQGRELFIQTLRDRESLTHRTFSYTPLINSLGEGVNSFIIEFSEFVGDTWGYASEIASRNPVMWLLSSAMLLLAFKKKTAHPHLSTFFPWLSSTLVCMMAIGAKRHPYYDVVLFPPVAVVSTLLLASLRGAAGDE